MQQQTELMLGIRDSVKEITGTEAVLTELTDDGRIYMEIGAGVTEKKYVRGPSLGMVPVMFLIKRPGAEEVECLEKLSEICNYYQAKRKPPGGESYQPRGLDIAAGPSKSARYQDGNVLYSCIINFKISY